MISDKTKPALIDCDGVLANFVQGVLDVAGSNLTPADIVQWDIFGLIEAEDDGKAYSAKKSLKDPDFWRHLPVMDGAKEAIAEIREHLNVVVATAPWISCAGWMGARHAWLKQHFGIKPDDVVIGKRKNLLTGGAFLLDDKPEAVEAFPGEAYLFDAPYNRTAPCYGRVHWRPEPGRVRRLGFKSYDLLVAVTLEEG